MSLSNCPKCNTLMRTGQEGVGTDKTGNTVFHTFGYCDICKAKYDLDIISQQKTAKKSKNKKAIIGISILSFCMLVIIGNMNGKKTTETKGTSYSTLEESASIEATLDPSVESSSEADPEPSVEPSSEADPEPSVEPSSEADPEPSVEPSVEPSSEADPEPSIESSSEETNTYTYVLNTSTLKIHHPNCKSVAKIKTKNYATTNKSLDELINEGYTKCGNCW